MPSIDDPSCSSSQFSELIVNSMSSTSDLRRRVRRARRPETAGPSASTAAMAAMDAKVASTSWPTSLVALLSGWSTSRRRRPVRGRDRSRSRRCTPFTRLGGGSRVPGCSSVPHWGQVARYGLVPGAELVPLGPGQVSSGEPAGDGRPFGGVETPVLHPLVGQR